MTSTANQHSGLSVGAEPRGVPAVQWITVIIGLALLGLAGVIGRDLCLRYSATPYRSWVAVALNWLGTVAIDAAVVSAGIAVAVVGLVCIVAALSPRPKTHLRVMSPVSVWTRPVDIARKSTFTAREAAGAHNIRSQSSRSSLKVSAQDKGRGEDLRNSISTALAEEFAVLERPPRIDVRLTPLAIPEEIS